MAKPNERHGLLLRRRRNCGRSSIGIGISFLLYSSGNGFVPSHKSLSGSQLSKSHARSLSAVDATSDESSTTTSTPRSSTRTAQPPEGAVDALTSLAQTTLALLSGDERAANALSGGAAGKRELVQRTFAAYDECGSGRLSVEEARALFVDLARSIVTEIASEGNKERGGKSKATAARSHARRVLAADENGTRTIDRVATKLLLLADLDGDGKVDLAELASMFDTVHKAQSTDHVETFPQPLRALAGSLQILPPKEAARVEDAASKALHYNVGVPGDDHTLRRVELENGLSIVGLGRSADASTYFIPDLSIVFDAGMSIKSLNPKTVLLTHGHRDHIGALPVHAQRGAKIMTPKAISKLVRRFLISEAQLNYGQEQTDEETIAALGEFDIDSVEDGNEILLPKSCYTGSPTPLGVQVFKAPHKDGVPAVSYGLYRSKNRLKEEFQSLPKSELGKLIQSDVKITESYNEGLLFYTGDTTIDLLRNRWEEILPKYRHIIHEVTFLGQPSSDLDDSTKRKGHTHYSLLHPWILAFPQVTFICVHWSLRYSREDVLDYFETNYGGVPKNVVLWI
jgi:ribonuclease Z